MAGMKVPSQWRESLESQRSHAVSAQVLNTAEMTKAYSIDRLSQGPKSLLQTGIKWHPSSG